MGLCNKRHFLLTICTLQIITTAERQVFDFLGFMWVPILFNFFNIIFVILGFFGAFQYRPKYVITYCVWNVLWLSWNVFLTCFYLNAGGLDKNSDLLNLGTGSFSWWHINGPGCKPHFNNTIDQPDFARPIRPDTVTGCVLEYEVIEVTHATTQCVLAVMAIVSGIFLCRTFMEEDDSFDFVGGGDFGTAGHTPLHPMYVSYSALPPAYNNNHHHHQQQQLQLQLHQQQQQHHHHHHHHHHQNPHNKSGDSYYYPTNTATTTGSHRSSSTTLIALPPTQDYPYKRAAPQPQPKMQLTSLDAHTPTDSRSSSYSRRATQRPALPISIHEYDDYSSPIDQLPQHRLDYDTLETHTPNLNRQRLYRQVQPPPVTYSPLMRSRQLNRGAGPNASNRHNRNSQYRPRVCADLIREQQPSRLRSFHSDPRLSVDEQSLGSNRAPRREQEPRRQRDGRPLSMFVNNYEPPYAR